MYVRKQPWCVKIYPSLLQRNILKFLCAKNFIPSLSMPKSRHAYNCKIKTPSLSLPIYQDFYAQKNISPLLFLPIYRLFAHLRRNFFEYLSLIQRNKIKDLSEYALNFLHFSYKRTKNPLTYTKEFRGTLSTKISHLLQIVYKRRKNTSHFLCRFKSTLSEYFFAFLLSLQPKKKAPQFIRDFRSTLTTLKSFFLQIV